VRPHASTHGSGVPRLEAATGVKMKIATLPVKYCVMSLGIFQKEFTTMNQDLQSQQISHQQSTSARACCCYNYNAEQNFCLIYSNLRRLIFMFFNGKNFPKEHSIQK
jgi:hypothetical protein